MVARAVGSTSVAQVCSDECIRVHASPNTTATTTAIAGCWEIANSVHPVTAAAPPSPISPAGCQCDDSRPTSREPRNTETPYTPVTAPAMATVAPVFSTAGGSRVRAPSSTAPSTNANSRISSAMPEREILRSGSSSDAGRCTSVGSARPRSSQTSTSEAVPVTTKATRHESRSASTPAPTEAPAVPIATPTINRAICGWRTVAGTVSPR